MVRFRLMRRDDELAQLVEATTASTPTMATVVINSTRREARSGCIRRVGGHCHKHSIAAQRLGSALKKAYCPHPNV